MVPFEFCSGYLHPVNQNVQAEPDNVHEVPVPCRTLETKVPISRKVTFLQTQGDEQQHQCADENMEAMKAGQHVKGRTKNARRELQVQVLISMNVLITLNEQKHAAKQNRHPHEGDGLAAVARQQGMVSYRECDARCQ